MAKSRVLQGTRGDRVFVCHVWLGALILCLAVPSLPFNVIVALMASFLCFGYLDERQAEREREG